MVIKSLKNVSELDYLQGLFRIRRWEAKSNQIPDFSGENNNRTRPAGSARSTFPDVYFHIHGIRQAQMFLSNMLVTGHPSILSDKCGRTKFSGDHFPIRCLAPGETTDRSLVHLRVFPCNSDVSVRCVIVDFPRDALPECRFCPRFSRSTDGRQVAAIYPTKLALRKPEVSEERTGQHALF